MFKQYMPPVTITKTESKPKKLYIKTCQIDTVNKFIFGAMVLSNFGSI